MRRTAALIVLFAAATVRAQGYHLTDVFSSAEARNLPAVMQTLCVSWWPTEQPQARVIAKLKPQQVDSRTIRAAATATPFTVRAELRCGKDEAALFVTLESSGDENREYSVRVAAPFDPQQWTRQFYPSLPYTILPPAQKTLLRYMASRDDATPDADTVRVVYYPFGVLENDREFLFWGGMDLGAYGVLTPNADANSIPCATLRPKQLKVGEPLRFALTLKRFPKPEYRYRDVLRWYLSHVSNSNPLTHDLIKYDPAAPVRHTTPGNLFGGVGGLYDASFWGVGRHAWEQAHLGKLWFQGWNAWDETYPTSGEWYNEWGHPIAAARIKDEIAKLKSNGIVPLLYCRQFLTMEGTNEDKAPYRSWVGRDENGNPAWWAHGPAPALLKKNCGINTLSQAGADFGNPDFLKWYISRVKQAVDVYEPGGIAWDMGWATPANWQYSQANPQSAMCHGEVYAQAELWRYLHQRHSGMQVIANEAPGTPSQLFADGVLLEGGSIAGKTALDYEAAKALGTTIIAYEYPDQYALRCRPLDMTKYRYCAFRYRARNIRSGDGDYVVYLSEGIPGKEGTLIANKDLIADNAWHTLVVDCARVPKVRGLKMIAFGEFASSAGDGHIEVQYIRFTDKADGSPSDTPVAAEPTQFPAEITFATTDDWDSRPQFLPGAAADDAGLTVHDGVGDFRVGTPEKGMRWLFSMSRRATTQELMMDLSYGACLGGGIAQGLPELYALSARAMGLPLLVDSHAVEVTPAGVTASAWAGDGALLAAAYNGSAKTADAALRIHIPASERGQWRKPRTVRLTTIGELGNPVTARDLSVTPTQSGTVAFSLTLQARQAALLSTE